MDLAIDLSREKYELIYDRIANDLNTNGWSLITHYYQEELINSLHHELMSFHLANMLTDAAVGRGDDSIIDQQIRGDKTLWLSNETHVQSTFLLVMESLRSAMNRRLFLGLFEFECHFALYAPGRFYQKHMDSFKGSTNRLLTTVTYLNKDWQISDGGMLVLYPPKSKPVSISPEAGSLVIFLSEEIPHEVEVTTRERVSIAGWFRCNNSLAGEIDPFN